VRRLRRCAALGLALAALALAGGCYGLDVIARGAVIAYGELASILPPQKVGEYWQIDAEDKTASFGLSADGGGLYISFDIAPFLDAGLKAAELPEGYEQAGDKLVLTSEPAGKAASADTAPSSLEALLRANPGLVSFHMAMGHYTIALGSLGAFEIAKDMAANEADIVFVLDPQALLDAGVDVEGVAGWNYSTVMVEADGMMVEAYKLLKPFNLKD